MIENNSMALGIFLQMAVPIAIHKIELRGGLTQSDLNTAESFLDEFTLKSDSLVRCDSPSGAFIGRLAEAIAIMILAGGNNFSQPNYHRIFEWIQELKDENKVRYQITSLSNKSDRSS